MRAGNLLRSIARRHGVGHPLLAAVFMFAVAAGWTAVNTVSSASVAVVQRLGQYLREVPPGLHTELPRGIDRATVVPAKRQLKLEFGFTTPGALAPSQVTRHHDGGRWAQASTRCS